MPEKTPYHRTDLAAIQLKISEGKEDAFGALLGLFTKRLINFAETMIHNNVVAEELVEDVFIKIWLRRSTLPSIQNLEVYLYVAVKNACINEISKKSLEFSQQPLDLFENGFISSETPADTLINLETLGLIEDIVDRLPPRCRLIFKLVREDGLCYKTVAEILDISVNTIDNQMATAVKRISESLHLNKPKSIYTRRKS